MEFQDRTLKCIDWVRFRFTAGEQLFFHDKQFKNDQALQGLQRQTAAQVGAGGTRLQQGGDQDGLLGVRERTRPV